MWEGDQILAPAVDPALRNPEQVATGLLKRLSNRFLRLFYDLRYQICTFCVRADGFKIFSSSGYFNILKLKRSEHCTICIRFTKAACDLLPRLPFSRLCITSGFPLAACDAQAGSL
jgi:hypothetical protein